MKEKLISILMIIPGFICLFLFSNVLAAGVFNVGNATGIVISLMIILYGFLRKQVNKMIGKIWSVTGGKIFLVFLSIVVLVILVLTIITTTCIVKGCNSKYEKDATLVVLGCQVRGETPSLMMVERLRAAKDYLDTYPDAVCVVSGGMGEGEDISEAEAMKRWLVENGISAERIYKEERSTSTDENIRFSKEIMDAEGLGDSISIATNEFHEYRAGRLADKYGLKHGAIPAKTAWWLLPTYYVREMYAILAENIVH